MTQLNVQQILGPINQTLHNQSQKWNHVDENIHTVHSKEESVEALEAKRSKIYISTANGNEILR